MSREFALPGTRPKYARDRVVDVEHLRLELDVDPDGRRIDGCAQLTCTAIAPGTRWVALDAVELVIRKVRVDTEDAPFTHDGKVLRIDLGEAIGPGDRVDLAIDYEGSPRRGLYFIHPDDGYPDKPVQVWSQGQDEDSRYWFPCFDQPHEKATSEVIVTLPKRFTALSNGEPIADRIEGDKRWVHWRHDVPHSCYLVTLVVGDLATIDDRWRDVAVAYHVERGREDEARRTLERTPRMLEVFSERFGVDYPYRRYAQVFVADFIFGGMENTTATTLTDAVLLDERAALDHDVDALVAHELAHQWFGDLVTCRDWGEGWLNEGFATYSEYVWREAYEGRDAADLELADWAEAYFGEDGGRYRRTIATKLYDEPIDIFDHHLYDKGGRVLHMLRQVLGDDAFWRTLRHYLEKHRHGSVETRDLARAVEEATGRVLDWFFSQWVLEGAGHPQLSVGYAWDPEARVATVTVKQTHKVDARTPLFRLPAVLRFRTGGVADHDVPIEIVDDRHVFHVPLPSEPAQAIFDPGRTLLAQLDVDKPLSVWAGELAGATLAIDRIVAARALGDKGGPRAEDALVTALRGDAFWAVRGAAAAALATTRTDRARDALERALAADAHPRARRAIVRALGDLREDARAIAAVERVVRDGDASYFVEAEACLQLGRLRAPSAPELLREAARRESYTDVIRQHAYRGLAEARDDGAIPLLLEGTAWGRPSQGRRAALGALAFLVRGRRDREAREVRERCERALEDKDFRVQSAAIEALASIGDPAAVAALRGLVGRELDGRLRRRALEVIRDLEEGRAPAEEVGKLRDEVGQLRDAVVKLKDQVERLQLAHAQAQATAAKPARPGSRGAATPRAKKRSTRPSRARGRSRRSRE